MTENSAQNGLELLCLPLDGAYYGFTLDVITETLQRVQITPFPCLPPHYCGVCNRKGSILPVVSLRRMAGGAPAGGEGHPVTVIVKCGECECGFLTETQPVLLTVSPDRLVREAAAELSGPLCVVDAVYATDSGIVLAVDAAATLERLVVNR